MREAQLPASPDPASVCSNLLHSTFAIFHPFVMSLPMNRRTVSGNIWLLGSFFYQHCRTSASSERLLSFQSYMEWLNFCNLYRMTLHSCLLLGHENGSTAWSSHFLVCFSFLIIRIFVCSFFFFGPNQIGSTVVLQPMYASLDRQNSHANNSRRDSEQVTKKHKEKTHNLELGENLNQASPTTHV